MLFGQNHVASHWPYAPFLLCKEVVELWWSHHEQETLSALEVFSSALGRLGGFLHLYPSSCLTRLPQPFLEVTRGHEAKSKPAKCFNTALTEGEPRQDSNNILLIFCNSCEAAAIKEIKDDYGAGLKVRGLLNWRLFWWGQWERQAPDKQRQPQQKNQTENSSE